MENSQNLWSKSFILVFLITFSISLGIMMQGAVLPLYLPTIGGNLTDVGLLTGLFTLVGFLFRPLFGHLTDHRGRRLVLLIGTIIFTVVAFFYGFATSVLTIFILRSLHGIGNSAQNTAIGTIISDIVPKNSLTKAFGYSLIASTIATAFGPILGLYFAQQYGYTFFFFFTFAVISVAFLASVFIKETRPAQTITPQNEVIKVAIFEKSALLPSAFMFLAGIGLASVFTFIVPFAMQKGIEGIGTFFTVYAIANLVGIKFTDWLSDRIGNAKSILLGLMTIMISFVFLGFAQDLLFLLIAGALVGYGFGSIMPSLQSIAISHCPPDRRGAATATFFSAMDISFGGGAILTGLIAEYFDLSQIFLGAGGLMILTMLLFIVTLYRRIEARAK